MMHVCVLRAKTHFKQIYGTFLTEFSSPNNKYFPSREKKHFTQYGRYELYMYMKVNGSSDLMHFNFLQQEFPADVNIRTYM